MTFLWFLDFFGAYFDISYDIGHILYDIELKIAENMKFDSTYRINLVSLKTIDIWPSYVPN